MTEKKTVAIEEDWLDRLYNMENVQVLGRVGPKTVRVETSDEVSLRMAVSRECKIDRE